MAKVALLIGVSEYQPGLPPLPGAVKDVEAMQRILVNPEMGGFAEADVMVLKNPQRQEMEDAIEQLFNNRQKEDLVLLYFSGHGIKDERGKLYLSTRATRKENGKLVKTSAVAATMLHESINDGRSERQVIILDCCFSGAIAQGMTVKDDGTVNVESQLGGKGRAILTSSTSTQYSFEQNNAEEQTSSGLSVYTQYLVEGIEKGAADQDGDGWISVDELHEYVSKKVTEAAPAMTPKFYPVEEGHKILLAKSPKDDPRLKYRKEVEKRINREGINRDKFSLPARRLLDSLRSQMDLDDQVAADIEAEVQQPYREYQRKLEDYEKTLVEAMAAESKLSEATLNDLRDYQQYLQLRDEDIAPIKERVGISEQLTPILKKKPDLGETVVKLHFTEDQSPVKDESKSVSANQAIEVFFSYAHKDEEFKDELVKHLSILKRQGAIAAWHDREISAGTEWAGEIDAHLNSARIILLLISSDFLASDYCYDIELTRAMERHANREARVIPVILRDVEWQGAPFGKLQALPKNAKPVTRWANLDAAFTNIAQGIRKAVEEEFRTL